MAGGGPALRFTGRTLQEALSRAASQLQAPSIDEVRYRVVDQKPGFLLVRSSVTIEAWIESPEASESELEREECSDVVLDGDVVRVKPLPEGEEPREVAIWSSSPVRLFVNGAELKEGEIAQVTSNDAILAEIGIDQTPSSEVHVNISKDQLTASIEIETHSAPKYELACESTPRGYRIYADKIGVNEPAPLTIEEVVEALKEKGVVYRINEEAIRQAISGEVTGEVVVSQGKPAEPTVQDQVDYKFETSIRRFDSDEVVDYYEFWVTPCVEPGDVIAEKIEGHQGEPGVKVTGEVMPVAPYRPMRLEAAEGAEVSQDGTKVVATRPGRPVLTRNKVGVNRLYELQRGVGLHTSNIHFDGDVFVRGDVSENMLVEATGSIDISGCGYECVLVAKRHIQVGRSFVGSHAVAGGSGGCLGRVYHGLRTMLPLLVALVDSVRFLDDPAQDDSSHKDAAVRSLLESRYRSLPAMAARLLEQAESLDKPFEGRPGNRLEYIKFEIPDDVYSIIKLLSASLNRPDLLKWSHLDSVLETVNQSVERLEQMLMGDCVAKIGYCQSSVVEADGDIQVLRQGSVNSTLRSGGNVSVAGVVRGGEVVCLSHFTAKEVGTISGTSTSIQILDPQGSLKASVVHPNVQLMIGDVSYKFTDSYRLVEAKIGAQGAITVISAGREV